MDTFSPQGVLAHAGRCPSSGAVFVFGPCCSGCAPTSPEGKRIESYRPRKVRKIRRCKCGHPKSIHVRMYGAMYKKSNLPQSCNYPDCKCKQYTPAASKD